MRVMEQDDSGSGWGKIPVVRTDPTTTTAQAVAQTQEAAATATETSQAAAASSIPPPPIIAPLVGADGMINPVWDRWMRKLWQKVGGAGTVSLNDITTLEAADAVALAPRPDDLSWSCIHVQRPVDDLPIDVMGAPAPPQDLDLLAAMLECQPVPRNLALPPMTTGNLRWSGSAWTFDATAYAPLSGGTFTGLCTFNAVVVVGTATAAQAKIGTTSGAGLVLWGKTGSSYDFALLNPANSAYWMRVVTGATYPEFPQGLNSLGVLRMSGTQVLTTQQTGLGTQLAAYTLTGTYATDLTALQNLYNKVVALETKLRAHGLVTT